MNEDAPPTISELISQLEQIRDEHGDLPVVYLEELWHVYPNPSVEEGRPHGEGTPEDNIHDKRVEL